MGDEELINIIKRYEVIYNIQCSEYRDAYVRNTAWEEISKLHGKPVEECKENWNKLRNCYNNAMKRRQKISDQAGKVIAPWRFELQMAFLKPYLEGRQTTGNLDEANSGKDLTWNMESSVEYFIKNVRFHPCLWNKNHVSYRDGLKKDNAWEIIAQQCGLSSGNEAKCQWKKLRDSHREAMRRRKPEAGPSAQYLGKWKYEEHMKFILDQSDTSETFDFNDTYDIQENKSKNALDIKNIVKFPVSAATSDSMSNNDPLSVESQKKRKIDMSYLYEERELLQEERQINRDDLLRQLIQNSRREDALSKFFDSLCEKTRDLPKYLQLRVQREVFDSVTRAEEEALCLIPGNNEHATVSKMSPQGYDDSSAGQQRLRDGNFEKKLHRRSIDSNDS